MQTRSRHLILFAALALLAGLASCNAAGKGGPTPPPAPGPAADSAPGREYNGPYEGPYLNRVAFPIGGMGAGMICLEGTGAFSHVSVRNRPDVFNEPHMWAAVCVKGKTAKENVAKVLEGPVPDWKIFGKPGTGNGATGASYGLPRFRRASFQARFPFGMVELRDPIVPLEVGIRGWSPFIPADPDNSSLPMGALEYTFRNRTNKTVEAVFSFNSKNWMGIRRDGQGIKGTEGGFILSQKRDDKNRDHEGHTAFYALGEKAVVDHCWFRGGWWDSLTLAWKNVQEARLVDNPPQANPPGASLFVPFSVKPGGEKTVRLLFCWYVPHTNIRIGGDPKETDYKGPDHFIPWYASKFKGIEEVVEYWTKNYDGLREQTELFTKTFYDSTLPAEVIEAVAANLTILKSPTVLRQHDGRLWCYEGCTDGGGCCHGSCTHVWNYTQAMCHLFPGLERTLRETEFFVSQDERGHQTFRTNLPIRPTTHGFHAASDGQFGGVMKVYREWRICGNTDWLKGIWPKVKKSLGYCIGTWDPRSKGVLEEPHHNTYDIEFWGPDAMCTSFYLGALAAAIEMAKAVGEDPQPYVDLLRKGKTYIEEMLYDGEYFYQKIRWKGLNHEFHGVDPGGNGPGYKDLIQALNEEGPKYQYGTGCISDAVLGFWIARCAGLGEIVDVAKVKSTLKAIHKYNLKRDLTDHANPQRPAFAAGRDGGLLLCTWPKGGDLSLPFVYSNEVWTGIEYQVASHLMLEGMVEEGCEIVRVARDRYNGIIRNPFNEYECGHWYARALSCYGMLQGLTGARYDAVEKALYIDSQIGNDFRSFLSTATGYGTVGLKGGQPFLEVKKGKIEVVKCVVSGREMNLQ